MSPLFGRRRRRGSSSDAPSPDPVPVPAAVPFERGEEGEIEASELAQRLQRLDWPSPGDDVRARCLEEIMKQVESGEMAPNRGSAGS